MAPSDPEAQGPPYIPGAEVMQSIREPAVLFTPGGRIAAVNQAAARLAPFSAIGMTIGELIDRYGATRIDGSPLSRGDLPHTRALRGEIVALGERVDINLPDGSVFRALVTSTPIIVDGRVVAALSVWHDFDRYVHGLAEPASRDRGPGRY